MPDVFVTLVTVIGGTIAFLLGVLALALFLMFASSPARCRCAGRDCDGTCGE